MDALRAAVRRLRDRGYPVWVGGHADPVRAVATHDADGWNWWGAGVDAFRDAAAETRAAASRDPFVVSWGGLVVLAEDDAAADAKARRLGAGLGVLVGGPERVADALHQFVDAGADWLMVGPVDSSDPDERDHARRAGRAIAALISPVDPCPGVR